MADNRESKEELISFYFNLGMSYKDILVSLSAKHGIIMSLRNLQRILRKEGLFRRKNYTGLAEMVRFIRQQLWFSGSQHGYRWMYQKCLNSGLNVRKEEIRNLLSILDPTGTEQRASRRLRRRSYFAKGPNYIWHFDSYDKLRPFGICINGCLDGFSRKVMWLNAYNTSSDPRVIASYYIETVENVGGCPRIVRADKGTENGVVCEFQRFLRQNGGDPFAGERSFIYGRSTCNQRIESWWSLLRKECTDFWISFFHTMKDEGHFDGDFLDQNLIIFCFMGLIQVSISFNIKIDNSLLLFLTILGAVIGLIEDTEWHIPIAYIPIHI
jgi:hypothetical protein